MSWILRTSEASRQARSGQPEVCGRDRLCQLKGFSSLGDQNQPNILCSSFVQCILWSRDISIYYDSCSVSLNVVVSLLELRGNTLQPCQEGTAVVPLPLECCGPARCCQTWFIVVILVFNILVVGTELSEASSQHYWGCGHEGPKEGSLGAGSVMGKCLELWQVLETICYLCPEPHQSSDLNYLYFLSWGDEWAS